MMESHGEFRERAPYRDELDTNYYDRNGYHSDIRMDSHNAVAGRPEHNTRFRISSLLSEKSPEHAPVVNYQKEPVPSIALRHRQHSSMIPRTYGHPYSYPPRTHTRVNDADHSNDTVAHNTHPKYPSSGSPKGYGTHRDSVCSVESAATGNSASSVSTRASLIQEPVLNPSYAYVSSPETPPEHFFEKDGSLTDSNTNGPETKGKSELKRLKNREAAARCRYRRKKQLGDLQEQVDLLQAEKAAMEKQKNERIKELQAQVERLLNEKEEQQKRIDMLGKILTTIKSGPGGY